MTTRRFTTADLENLTEGTTPGPWVVGATTDLGHVYVGAANPDVGGIIAETGHDDAPLIAASRELAADYHSVRTGVEKLISQLAQHAAATLDGRALDIATELDRILNGDTHE